MVGVTAYLSVTTRPDTSFATSIGSNLTPQASLRKKDLVETKAHGIVYFVNERQLIGYADANLGNSSHWKIFHWIFVRHEENPSLRNQRVADPTAGRRSSCDDWSAQARNLPKEVTLWNYVGRPVQKTEDIPHEGNASAVRPKIERFMPRASNCNFMRETCTENRGCDVYRKNPGSHADRRTRHDKCLENLLSQHHEGKCQSDKLEINNPRFIEIQYHASIVFTLNSLLIQYILLLPELAYFIVTPSFTIKSVTYILYFMNDVYSCFVNFGICFTGRKLLRVNGC